MTELIPSDLWSCILQRLRELTLEKVSQPFVRTFSLWYLKLTASMTDIFQRKGRGCQCSKELVTVTLYPYTLLCTLYLPHCQNQDNSFPDSQVTADNSMCSCVVLMLHQGTTAWCPDYNANMTGLDWLDTSRWKVGRIVSLKSCIQDDFMHCHSLSIVLKGLNIGAKVFLWFCYCCFSPHHCSLSADSLCGCLPPSLLTHAKWRNIHLQTTLMWDTPNFSCKIQKIKFNQRFSSLFLPLLSD